MKKLTWLVVLALVFSLCVPAIAAPLFSDVPSEHWAKDAVANLAAKGMLEGYPDGTFKGDRAATRWEMAMVVARLLAKMEQENATFASKEDLEAVKTMVNGLKDELQALGVRVSDLEDKYGKLDKRVSDLERIRFYGSLDTIYNGIGFTENAALGYYNEAVMDFFNGRPQVNGSALSFKGILGVKAVVSDDISAGGEFMAFSSSADEVIDAYYGVSAPYMSNFFTSNAGTGVGLQGAANAPWTRMTLDNFWIQHNPSGLKAIIGAYDAKMDSIIYAGELNPNVNGPKFLNNYGFNVSGTTHIFAPMDYEILYTKLADGAYCTPGAITGAQADYRSDAYGIDLNWKFNDKGNFKLNFLSAQNNPSNFPSGFAATGDYAFDALNASYGDISTAFGGGLGSSINMWANPTDQTDPNRLAMIKNNFGPQAQQTYGLSLNYDFDPNAPLQAKVELSSSSYKPTIRSGYSKTGTALLIGLTSSLMEKKLDLGLDYLSVDPYYDPMLLQYPAFVGAGAQIQGFMRFPDFNYFPGLYQLHDSEKYPNNRTGFRFLGAYKFQGDDGVFKVKFAALTQVKSSAFDNGNVAYNPGFIEPVFRGYNAGLANTNDPKGNIGNFGASIDYKFSGTKLKLGLGYDDWTFKRDAIATAGVAVVGKTDVDYNKWNLVVCYPLSEKFMLKAGYDVANMTVRNDRPAADNTYTQSVPYLGFDYQVSKNTAWGLNARFNNFTTKTDPLPAGADNYTWTGTQLMSELKVSF